MKTSYFKRFTTLGLVLAALVSVGPAASEDIHFQNTLDDRGRASLSVMEVAAEKDSARRKLQAPPPDDYRAFFYGRVWFDNNANGKMDPREEGMPFVRVSLWRANRKAAMKSRTTDKDGYFEIPLKYFHKRVDREYFLQLEMNDEKKTIYRFFDRGDSQVDESGKSDTLTIPAYTTIGGRYKINAGVRAKTAVFYGTMWHDSSANDMMDEDEERVLRNPVTLLRAEDGAVEETVQEKKTGKNSGTYELALEEIDPDNAYKYFVEFRLPQEYIFVTYGDSQVDDEGRGMQTSVANGRRYKVNAGIRPKDDPNRPFLIFTASFTFKGDPLSYTHRGSQPFIYSTPLGSSTLADKKKQISQPEEYTSFNGHVYFSAPNSLWKTDLTRDGTNIVPGSEDSNPFALTAFMGSLYFFAKDGSELWVLRGATPTVLKRFENEATTTPDARFTEFKGSLYFITGTRQYRTQLWRTDGTPEGTVLIKAIKFDGDPEYLFYVHRRYDLTVYRDKLFFIHVQAESRRDLWSSDGTEDGTVIADGIYTNYWLCGLMVLKDKLYYFVKSEFPGPVGYLLWEYDGSRSKLIKTIPYEGKKKLLWVAAPLYLKVMDGKLFFAARSGHFVDDTDPHKSQLWVSDGSNKGTRVVKDDITIGPSRREVIEFRNRLYFAATDFHYGKELWSTDGSEASTELVKDVRSGVGSVGSFFFTVCKDRLYFLVLHGGEAEMELWSTDGTTDGTDRIETFTDWFFGAGILHCIDDDVV